MAKAGARKRGEGRKPAPKLKDLETKKDARGAIKPQSAEQSNTIGFAGFGVDGFNTEPRA